MSPCLSIGCKLGVHEVVAENVVVRVGIRIRQQERGHTIRKNPSIVDVVRPMQILGKEGGEEDIRRIGRIGYWVWRRPLVPWFASHLEESVGNTLSVCTHRGDGDHKMAVTGLFRSP